MHSMSHDIIKPSKIMVWGVCVMRSVTHEETYAEAVQHGQEVLEMLIQNAVQDSEPLPPPMPHAAV